MRTSDRALPERLAKIAAICACAWFALAATWNMFALPGGGHVGAGSCGNALMAEQIWRWKIAYPAWTWTQDTPPTPSLYYCHHPFGFMWLTAAFQVVFGIGDVVLYLPAVVMSSLTPVLLYQIGKEHWGRIAGAAMACAFSIVPIAVGFSSFNNLEQMGIFGAALFFFGHSRYRRTGRVVDLAASLTGLAFLVGSDWIGYITAAPLLGWSFLALVLPPLVVPSNGVRAYARWWALSVTLAVMSLALWVGLFHKAGHIGEWLGAAASRSAGAEMSLAQVLEARRPWIDFSFTPLVILLGKVALPVCVVRLLVLRRDEEIYALAVLLGATVQYLAFKNGADVHIFWSHYFAAYYALAIGQLVATCEWALGAAARQSSRPGAALGAQLAALAIAVVPQLVVLPDAVRALKIWRLTGGRYNDNGSFITTDVETLVVVRRVIAPLLPKTGTIDTHSSARWYWNHQWVIHRPNRDSGAPLASQTGEHTLWIGRASGMSAVDQRDFVQKAHVRIYGDTWVVDQREPPAPLDAYAVVEREPNLFEWFFTNGTEPVRTLGSEPDPLLTWEWRALLGQAAEAKAGEARSIDEARVAHNAAKERGDAEAATKLRAELDAQLDRSVATRFDNGTTLLGARVVGRVNPRVEAWFEAGDKPADSYFRIRSTLEKKDPLSLIPLDPVEREMALPSSHPAKLWRPGHIYKAEALMNHRIGRERYFGFWSAGPHRVDGRPETVLATVN